MSGITIFEFDALTADGVNFTEADDVHQIPHSVLAWLEEQCLRAAEARQGPWLRWCQRGGRRAIQVTSFVGVIRAPDGYQIEVLPKVGKNIGGGVVEVRQLLIDMLCCLPGFRHIQTDNAKLAAAKMPLLEVFVSEFLRAVERVVKRGLRSDYRQRQDNLFALRGKLMMAPHLRQNLYRADRFLVEFDEFSTDRPENRLLHAALRRVLKLTRTQTNQQLARELDFVFADVPLPKQIRSDFQQVRVDRGMGFYTDALAWARLILDEESPLTGSGRDTAPSLLFPMEAVFEAYVTKHLSRQLNASLTLKTQARSHHLVEHREQNWFQLKPDFLVRQSGKDILVLDAKWKLLDRGKMNGSEKYGLSQSDFYQLQAYGVSYLDGVGDVVLIYPKTDEFSEPLSVFDFPKNIGMRLWVLPFCLKQRRLMLPSVSGFGGLFVL
ncbi:McrC family protein [Granulosicoccus antarcticus]|uniref:5-methylcytosine-specific restriction enzyme subunit McrC n=1 Tax=Granulosicoccus antarcticus IMCC3135 TaxID=1192854 RepID=A0A2Z2NMX8_9GAMM|nr:McrC family protein [Granulosicoccus antarcticus]ASJ72812.1 hypothetical protein IMCC3135_13635 [Granulosicoccus antarcticus IMCC3135]